MVKVISKNKAKPTRQQMAEILDVESVAIPKRRWNSFFGKVHFGSQPVVYQRKLRDEA